MRTLLETAFRSAFPQETLLCLRSPVPLKPASVARVLAHATATESLIYYAPPTRYKQFTYIGWGVADRIILFDRDPFVKTQDAICERLKPMRILDGPDCEDLPLPRFFGGFRYTPGKNGNNAENAVSMFPDSGFVLPRFCLCFRDDKAFLQLTLFASELPQKNLWETELASFEQALHNDPVKAPIVDLGPISLTDETTQTEYCQRVKLALTEIASGSLQKVVLARRKIVSSAKPFELNHILGFLDNSYSDCCRFALSVGGFVFLGASPELLARKTGLDFSTEALAGTRPRKQHVRDDEQQTKELLSDEKERREHRCVQSTIVDSIAPFCASEPVVDPTVIRSLLNVHHLCTPIHATLSKGARLLEIVAALHPTPAVCGLPRPAAARFIAAQEPFARGLYAAPIGWLDQDGNGTFWVAIRSALLSSQKAWLTAGSGIVAGADPQKEYLETGAKFAPMLAALGVAHECK